MAVSWEKNKFVWPGTALLLTSFLFFAVFYVRVHNLRSAPAGLGFRSFGGNSGGGAASNRQPYDVTRALVHYATTPVTLLQTKEEIMVTAMILSQRGPCNFLVYGLGFDSPLWDALNAGGRTIFLEENLQWIAQVARQHPHLTAYHVEYRTRLKDADSLMKYAQERQAVDCNPAVDLRTSTCQLALTMLPAHLFDIQWDVILVDAPTGYYPDTPGRMSSIFTSAVMARQPPAAAVTESGASPTPLQTHRVTDVLVHDMDRPVEVQYANHFICKHNQIARVGRLAHFQIVADSGRPTPSNKVFCSSDQ